MVIGKSNLTNTNIHKNDTIFVLSFAENIALITITDNIMMDEYIVISRIDLMMFWVMIAPIQFYFFSL
jgi:hypothetical protein